MDKTLVIIIGPHAVGKMTVGQELEKITGLRLFHNHMSIELALKLFEFSDPEYKILNQTIRETVFNLFAKGNFKGLIFTFMCDFDVQSEFDYLNDLITLFKNNGAKCHVVELCADFDERIKRNKSENRLYHKESKRNIEFSESEMRRTSKHHRLNSYDEEKIPFESYVKIDNTNLSPETVAKMIKDKFDIADK